jgi:hypothetical protein
MQIDVVFFKRCREVSFKVRQSAGGSQHRQTSLYISDTSINKWTRNRPDPVNVNRDNFNVNIFHAMINWLT